MKAILISIKPKYVAKILNGEKTIEIRKTMPKCELPIDVYIYCTKDLKSGKQSLTWLNEKSFKQVKNITYEEKEILGKVVAKFTLNKVEEIELPYTKFNSTEWVGCEAQRTLQTKTLDEKDLLKLSCLKEDEIYGYLNFKKSPNNVGYAWNISNLQIFDKPKELSEFKANKKYWCDKCPYQYGICLPKCEELKRLTKAPKSWQFIEGEDK